MKNQKSLVRLADFGGIVADATKTKNVVSQNGITKSDVEVQKIFATAQVRKIFDDSKLAELAENIKLRGIEQPIALHKENEKFRIIYGERRYRAAVMIGLKFVPAVVYAGLTELRIREMQIAENQDRQDLALFDIASGVSEDVAKFGLKEAMRIWGKSESWMSKHTTVNKLDQDVLNLAKINKCNDLELLGSLNQLHKIDASEFNFFSNQIAGGNPVSREAVRNKVSLLKETAKERYKPDNKNERGNKMRAGAVVDEPMQETETSCRVVEKRGAPIVKNGEEQSVVETNDEAVKSSREKLFLASISVKNTYESIVKTKALNSLDTNEREWIWYSGLLTTVLPVLTALGQKRTRIYLSRLTTELKSASAKELFEVLHAPGTEAEKIPTMPVNWRI